MLLYCVGLNVTKETKLERDSYCRTLRLDPIATD